MNAVINGYALDVNVTINSNGPIAMDLDVTIYNTTINITLTCRLKILKYLCLKESSQLRMNTFLTYNHLYTFVN